MSEITALHLTIGFTVLLVFILFFIRKRMKNKDYLIDLFLLGVFGWTIAYFIESLPFRLFNSLDRYQIGLDINDPNYIPNLSVNWSVLLLAPLLIGVIEETARYQTFRLYNSIDKLMFKYRFKSSVILGMGWASAEILVLSSFAMLEGYDFEINFYTIVIGIYARLLSYLFHISLSFIVIFAVYEKSMKSRSLLIAILFNILINIIFSLWILFFRSLALNHPLIYLFTQQIMIGLGVISIVIFTWKYWIPYSDTNSTPSQNENKILV